METFRKRKSVSKPAVDLPEGTEAVVPMVPLPIPDTKEITKDVPPTMVKVSEPLRSIPLPAETTEQEDLVTYGQRRVNLIWEITQAIIAVTVSIGTLAVAAALVIRGDISQGAFLLLSNAFFLIIGFYFSRTNHTAIGGVGGKPNQKYEGR